MKPICPATLKLRELLGLLLPMMLIGFSLLLSIANVSATEVDIENERSRMTTLICESANADPAVCGPAQFYLKHGRWPESSAGSQPDFAFRYCLQFKQLESNGIGLMIREMSITPFPIHSYFLAMECSLRGYGGVKGPILHLVGDDPNAKERSLYNVGAYYLKKLKQPELLSAALNARNERGETMLDYFETLKQKDINTDVDQQPPRERIIAYVCAHGGQYAKYPRTCLGGRYTKR